MARRKLVDPEQILDLAKTYGYQCYQHGRFRGQHKTLTERPDADSPEVKTLIQRAEQSVSEFAASSTSLRHRLEELLNGGSGI